MPRPRLVLFVKEPRPGRVKTRLAAGIGTVAAAGWLRRTLAGTVRRLGRDPRWELVLAVTPDTARQSALLPAGLPRIGQGDGDLGTRMRRALEAGPPGPAVLIGADIPGVTRAHVARAFAALGPAEAVFGPAEDGGYWLIGMRGGARRWPRDALAGVRWSGPHALSDSRATLGDLPVACVDRLPDVDRVGDLPPAARR